jgi:hypothetical protein
MVSLPDASEARMNVAETAARTADVKTMTAIVQDEYRGAADVLRVEEIHRPKIRTTMCRSVFPRAVWIEASGI